MTRFYVLSNEEAQKETSDRLAFIATGNAKGLPVLMAMMDQENMTLVTIHDRPKKTVLGEYDYVIECEDVTYDTYCKLEEIQDFSFRYLGSFKLAEDAAKVEMLSDEQALLAIRNYCFMINPDLEGIVKAEEYPVYWEIASSDEREIVVMFRSYTGAQIRYYIDRITGDTYVTEYVPGITTEEQRTDECLNVRDYVSED